eukprot:TRINITY_DN21712_c0_g1_i1.p1 TRINITY_DN21712_c0_g1~~TRINITY_DN21712_c0_g1_i1.p1  ORF type:complete len:284 (+),score=46.83 TRINITY_DN21712_c0_g1_i1:84-935(+)
MLELQCHPRISQDKEQATTLDASRCDQAAKDLMARDDTHFWHQISMGSTTTGTPFSIDAISELASLSRSASHARSVGVEASKQACTLFTEDTEDEDDPLEQYLVKEDRLSFKVYQPSGSGQAHRWRRRKYYHPSLRQGYLVEPQPHGASQCFDDDEVLICGPLQQRCWGLAWRWRWCVLKGDTLYLYRDEACWRGAPTDPFETIEVKNVLAVSENSGSGLFRCLHNNGGSTIATFRGGDCDLWEEIAATHLWVDLINSAARDAHFSGSGVHALKRIPGGAWDQ